MSSWAKGRCYDCDFGGDLGKDEAIRRPAFDAWVSLAYYVAVERRCRGYCGAVSPRRADETFDQV